MSGLNDALEKEVPGTKFEGYLNYMDPELTVSKAHRCYYSTEMFKRSVEIKKTVNPGKVLSNPQGVRI